MTRTPLLRGMLVGVVAGLLVFAFARLIGEPQVERAIAFETSMDQAKGEAPEPEMVSRKVQKGFGLLTAVVLVPTLKYPANPPSVGNPETIGMRTAAFFLLTAFSIATMVFALQVER